MNSCKSVIFSYIFLALTTMNLVIDIAMMNSCQQNYVDYIICIEMYWMSIIIFDMKNWQ